MEEPSSSSSPSAMRRQKRAIADDREAHVRSPREHLRRRVEQAVEAFLPAVHGHGADERPVAGEAAQVGVRRRPRTRTHAVDDLEPMRDTNPAPEGLLSLVARHTDRASGEGAKHPLDPRREDLPPRRDLPDEGKAVRCIDAGNSRRLRDQPADHSGLGAVRMQEVDATGPRGSGAGRREPRGPGGASR